MLIGKDENVRTDIVVYEKDEAQLYQEICFKIYACTSDWGRIETRIGIDNILG